MADIRCYATVMHLLAAEITLRQSGAERHVTFLEVGAEVRIRLGEDPAADAEAMRRLAVLAAEAAGKLERQAAEQRGDSDG